MNTTADGGLAERILHRPLPAWRDARVDRRRWTVSLRNKTILSRQSVYGLHGYRTYRAFQLRSWSTLMFKMHLRSVYEHFAEKPWFDTDSAAEVVAILDSTLRELEQPDPNVAVVDDDLGRALSTPRVGQPAGVGREPDEGHRGAAATIARGGGETVRVGRGEPQERGASGSTRPSASSIASRRRSRSTGTSRSGGWSGSATSAWSPSCC